MFVFSGIIIGLPYTNIDSQLCGTDPDFIFTPGCAFMENHFYTGCSNIINFLFVYTYKANPLKHVTSCIGNVY